MTKCKTLGCDTSTEQSMDDFCYLCLHNRDLLLRYDGPQDEPQTVSPVPIDCPDHPDIYDIHHRFSMVDPSGALHHASRTLLLCSRPENLSEQYAQVTEARDLLNRWLELNHL